MKALAEKIISGVGGQENIISLMHCATRSAAGFNLVTPILIINSDDYIDVLVLEKEQVLSGSDLLSIIK